MYSLCGQVAPHPASALRRSLSSLHSKKTSLQKRSSRLADLNHFLHAPFELPSRATASKQPSELVKKLSTARQPKIEGEAIQVVNEALAVEVANLKSICLEQQDPLEKNNDKIKRLEEYKPTMSAVEFEGEMQL